MNETWSTLKVLLAAKSTWLMRGVNSVPGATTPRLTDAGVRPGMMTEPGVHPPLHVVG